MVVDWKISAMASATNPEQCKNMTVSHGPSSSNVVTRDGNSDSVILVNRNWIALLFFLFVLLCSCGRRLVHLPGLELFVVSPSDWKQ
jgi:hypothetical protein